MLHHLTGRDPVSRFPFRARLELSIPLSHFGQRGITPAFGYDALHPSARGTQTLPINALPGAHYESIRLPTSAQHYTPVLPCIAPPTEKLCRTRPGLLGSDADLSYVMQSSTPAERQRLAIAAMLMLPSCPRKHSASTTKAISGLTCCTLHDSCLRFEHDVTGALARLGSHLPATALVTKDLHLHVKHQLCPAHSWSATKVIIEMRAGAQVVAKAVLKNRSSQSRRASGMARPSAASQRCSAC